MPAADSGGEDFESARRARFVFASPVGRGDFEVAARLNRRNVFTAVNTAASVALPAIVVIWYVVRGLERPIRRRRIR